MVHSRFLCHAWDYVTGQYELVLHSEVQPDNEAEEEPEYNSRSRSQKRSIVIPDNAEYTPVTRTEYELTYYVNNVNTGNTQVLMEYDENGMLKNSYTYGNERISIAGEEKTDYYLYDGRGSVSQVVNADNIVEAYTYDPFGNVTGGAPVFESFYGYNAEETNPVTGLQYLRARYYDSTTGRFSTADSYLGDVTNPLTLNRYIYTLNNPVMYNDPSGHFAKGIADIWDSIKEGAENVAEWAEETGDKIYNWGKKTTNKIYNTTTQYISVGKELINTNIVQPMSNALKKAVNAMEKSDSEIANNLAAKLRAAATTLNNAKHTLEETTAQAKQMIYNDFCDLTQKVESGWTSAVEWTSTNIIKPVKKFINGMVEDYNNYDKYNESEEKVLESNYFSSYKGVPVFRINYERSGSFGAIFLSREANIIELYPEDVVRHEYGHTKQLKQLGVIKYALCIGLPSWQNWGSGEYYDKPWEITADIYGGVESRVHLESDIEAGYGYLEASKYIGPLVWIFIEQEEDK